MKDKKKLHSAALASITIVLFLFVFSSAASASIADNSHDVTSTNICIETRITTNESEQSYPAIYENKIVWTDKRNGNWDIYMYDISTSKEKRITTDESEQSYPVIYGNRIVWTDNRNGNYDI